MTCPGCGKNNFEEAKFCIECGEHMPIIEEVTARFDREELQQYDIPPLECQPIITFGAKTDLGLVRENNEDKWDFYIPDEETYLAARGSLFIVCDGMGGHAAGQIASELACKTFISEYYGPIERCPEDTAKLAAKRANRYIFDISQTVRAREGMGTTLTALAFYQKTALLTHIGDSRCYRLRGETIEQISEDHTWVAEQVKLGDMTEAEALHSPYAHVITRACGVASHVESDTTMLNLEEGDAFVLCSDGLTNHVDAEAIAEVLKSNTPSPAALQLLKLALEGGGSDNCTVVVIKIDGFKELYNGENSKLIVKNLAF